MRLVNRILLGNYDLVRPGFRPIRPCGVGRIFTYPAYSSKPFPSSYGNCETFKKNGSYEWIGLVAEPARPEPDVCPALPALVVKF